MALVRYTNTECFCMLKKKLQVCLLRAFAKLTLKGLFPTQRRSKLLLHMLTRSAFYFLFMEQMFPFHKYFLLLGFSFSAIYRQPAKQGKKGFKSSSGTAWLSIRHCCHYQQIQQCSKFCQYGHSFQKFSNNTRLTCSPRFSLGGGGMGSHALIREPALILQCLC